MPELSWNNLMDFSYFQRKQLLVVFNRDGLYAHKQLRTRFIHWWHELLECVFLSTKDHILCSVYYKIIAVHTCDSWGLCFYTLYKISVECNHFRTSGWHICTWQTHAHGEEGREKRTKWREMRKGVNKRRTERERDETIMQELPPW